MLFLSNTLYSVTCVANFLLLDTSEKVCLTSLPSNFCSPHLWGGVVAWVGALSFQQRVVTRETSESHLAAKAAQDMGSASSANDILSLIHPSPDAHKLMG